MIDLKFARENPDAVKASQRARGREESIVDDLIAADDARRSALTQFESLRAEQKSFGKKIAQAQGDEKAPLLAQAKDMAESVKIAQATATAEQEKVNALQASIQNIVADGVPAGGEEDYVVLKEVGTIRDFATEGFEPRDHLELGENLKLIDMARGAKVSGSRFYFLTGLGARLELALLNLAVAKASEWGFTPMITPTVVLPEVMAGTGFLGEHSDEIYHLDADDMYLVGTSEVALAGYHADEILDLSSGPLRYAGWSSCYRREAGSHGRDTRGIMRVHQFNKVEMFSYCSLDDAQDEHDRLLAWEEEMIRAVDLPYRVIDTAAGDLGSSAARKFDCEAWVPTQGRYREITSTSNCTTYQARRLSIRERGESGTQPVATLNGTLATTRWLVAILENHQNADGSVTVPEALQSFMGGISVISPA